ncbi:hypothetical protein HRG_014047 [Hirsutella rhossiliensis]
MMLFGLGTAFMASPQESVKTDSDQVRVARTSGLHMTNVWDASACGLTDERSLSRLTGLWMGSEDAPDENVGHPKYSSSCQRVSGNAATYLQQEPSYVPYKSFEVKRCRSGDDMCRQAFDLVFCQEVTSSVKASPLAATALITAASLREGLWPGRGSEVERGLAVVAAIAPKKGGEAVLLIREYRRRQEKVQDSAVPMVLRDFFASIYAWQFIRCTDGRLLDLCGSALCMTTAIDYVGAGDDPIGGGHDAYMAAASEGVACLAGKAATQALRDMVIADSFMVAKDEMTEAARDISNTDEFIRLGGGGVTPIEFLRARWWDAAMVPYHRLVMGTSHYKHLTDNLGTFSIADTCGNIKRAVDSIIRYNEIADIVSDYTNRECFNELLVAIAVGGSNGARGYANAVARVPDDTLALQNWLWAAVYGTCWHRETWHEGMDVVREAYTWPAPGTRLRAVADISLKPGNTLHATTWQPLWEGTNTRSRDIHQQGLVYGLSRRIEVMHRSITVAIKRASGHYLQNGVTYLKLSWQVYRRAAVWSTVFGDMLLSGPTMGTDERLFIDVDQAVRQTYLLPSAEGIAIRRAFFGVTSGSVELSGLNPYARLSDGAALMHDLRDTCCCPHADCKATPWVAHKSLEERRHAETDGVETGLEVPSQEGEAGAGDDAVEGDDGRGRGEVAVGRPRSAGGRHKEKSATRQGRRRIQGGGMDAWNCRRRYRPGRRGDRRGTRTPKGRAWEWTWLLTKNRCSDRSGSTTGWPGAYSAGSSYEGTGRKTRAIAFGVKWANLEGQSGWAKNIIDMSPSTLLPVLRGLFRCGGEAAEDGDEDMARLYSVRATLPF